MLDTRNIHSLSDFLRNHPEHLNRLKETRRSEVLAVGGKAEAVLLDVENYQERVDSLEEAKSIAMIREGRAAAIPGS